MPPENMSLDELLATDDLPEDEYSRLLSEKVLGSAAMLLVRRGTNDLAALLLDVQMLDLSFGHEIDPRGDEPWGRQYGIATLEVEPHVLGRFTDDVLERLMEAMNVVVRKTQYYPIEAIKAAETIPMVGEDWRQRLARELAAEQPTNQAVRVRMGPQHPQEDGLHLTNHEEWKVYRILKVQQGALPANDTFSIVPLAGVRIPEHTYEPDFVIIYKGRAGIIEVDGPHHQGRRIADSSRERLLRNAGFRHIDRIAVEDTSTAAEVERFVVDFLKHLSEQ